MFGWISNSISFLAKGGLVMIPLMLCSVTAVAVIIERIIQLQQSSKNVEQLMNGIKESLSKGNTGRALNLCEQTPGIIADVLACGIQNQEFGLELMERAMEEKALAEVPTLQKNLMILDTIITIAPLLGLLGTVTGMIGSFHIISSTGVSQPNAITGGVAEALIATATGLTIAITCLIAYNFLTDKVKQVISQIEYRATQLINFSATLRSSGYENKTTRA